MLWNGTTQMIGDAKVRDVGNPSIRHAVEPHRATNLYFTSLNRAKSSVMVVFLPASMHRRRLFPDFSPTQFV